MEKVNQSLCQNKETPHRAGKGYDAVRKLWQDAEKQPVSLRRALDLMRQGHDLNPFGFFNGNTMAAVCKQVMEDSLKSLSPVEAQIVRTTCAHYVVGTIKARELEEVLNSFAASWSKAQTAPATKAPAKANATALASAKA